MTNQQSETSGRWIVPYPANESEHLPLESRWEFARRHPYYEMFWRSVHPFPGLDDESASLTRQGGALVLAAINVSTDTVAPSTEWAEIEPRVRNPLIAPSAISRVNLRKLVVGMMGTLSREQKQLVAEIMRRSAEIDDPGSADSYELLQDVIHGDHPNLEAHLPELMVKIRPRASDESISSAIRDIAQRFRRENDIQLSRLRVDRFDDYLKVWDLREGWNNGTYDRSNEHSLSAVAKLVSRPRQTVMDQYRSAFKLIVGQEYSRDCWEQVVGCFKLLGYIGGAPGLMLRRRGRSGSIIGVTESDLSASSNLIAATIADRSDVVSELVEQEFRDVIATGRSTEEIIEMFDLDPAVSTHIDSYRRMFSEI